MKTTINETTGLKTLIAIKNARFMEFSKMLDVFADGIGFKNNGYDKFSEFEIEASDFTKAGFSADEAAALLFIVAEGAENLDEIDGFLARNKTAIALLK
jgi:hypothetical protein